MAENILARKQENWRVVSIAPMFVKPQWVARPRLFPIPSLRNSK